MNLFEKEDIEVYLGRIFDFDGDEDSVSFETNYGFDEMFSVSVTRYNISIDNTCGGGFIKEVGIETESDICEALENACNESDGWECY